ncbi:MAG: TlpA disulfide reductase family protein [Holophagaceae bacterium]
MDLARILLAMAALSPLLGAADNPKVAALAKAGHWQASGWAAHGPMLGKPAPLLELTGWVGGEVPPEARKGKILLLDFWATWCGPCIAAIPHNNALAKHYAAKGVLVLGLCGSGRGEEKMPYYAQLLQLGYPTAWVSAASTKAWNVQWWPTYAIVDRAGVLRATGLQPDFVERVLDALLEEQPGP